MQQVVMSFNEVPECGALFSQCEKFRYILWRWWDDSGPSHHVMFVGLNPSTADETNDDPTIRRCIRFSKDWGYGGLVMMNAFAFRATDPKVMKSQENPLGPLNMASLKEQGIQASLVIAAWGAHCPEGHERKVLETIGRDVHCLGKTKAGRPKHPLYLKADSVPELFWSPDRGKA